MFHVAHNADDLPRPVLVHGPRLVAHQQLLADGIDVGEIAMRESLVDHDGPGRSLCVMVIQEAAFAERDPQALQEAGTYLNVPRVGPVIRWRP